MFAETEGFLTAIQELIILTRNNKEYILKQPDTDELCSRCGKELETIQHITAACEQLAPTEYVKRHDGLAKIIHQKLAEAAELIDDKSPYYKYIPASVLENENFKLYWNRSLLRDKTIPFNRPDVTFMNKKTKNTFLIDIAVPNTHNLAKTITDNQNKYQDLANEICSMWKRKAAQVIPIVISTGLIPKSNKTTCTRIHIYTTVKICSSWHMFNCKKLFKLQIRQPSLILLISTSQDRSIFPSQSREVRNSMMIFTFTLALGR